MKIPWPPLVTAALAVAVYFVFFRKAPGDNPPPGQSPPQPQDVPPSADLSAYPVHGAPAIADVPGSHTNILASYPSLISGLASNSTSSSTAPVSLETGSSSNQTFNKQGFLDFESANKQTNLAAQALDPGLAGVGLKGSNASGGFLSGAFQFLSALGGDLFGEGGAHIPETT